MKRKITVVLSLIFIISCLVFTGCTSEVKDKNISIKFQDKDYAGTYTGTCENGIPNGQGSFKYKKDKEYLNYKGNFKDGQISDKGTLKTNLLLVKFKEVNRVGEYKGDVINGIPNGNGNFVATNDAKVKYTYEGQWKNGIFNGIGTQTFDDDSLTYIGQWKNGKFIPDFRNLIITFGTDTNMPYTISDKANGFLKKHLELFPADNYEQLAPFVNKTIEYKHISKSPSQYGDQIMVISGTVSQIFEDVVDDDDFKYSATEIYVYDNNDNYYWICYPGTCNIYEGDNVTIYGLPLDSSSYENNGGGTTLVQVIAGCYIENK
ncbi:MORN repeat-containing protein [Aminipila terrae]|uniref:MORN repeat-containing protein n=1 Tax=Aminipila terrae TaxID=2697030 RepID=A0A6P1MQN9_9FIRM|nr:hypothetical protein [Aminipila terrae]QHI73315.1 hypothetical protein Ami3637_13860 [Aminipila terrae]